VSPCAGLAAAILVACQLACSSSATAPRAEVDNGGEADTGFGAVGEGGGFGGGTPDAGGGASFDAGGEGGSDAPFGERANPDAATLPGGEVVGVDDEEDAVCGLGTLMGLVCSPSAQVFVNGAKVWIDTLDCSGAPLHLETYTTVDGAYAFVDSVPSGYQTVHIDMGGFQKTQLVFVKAGKVSDVSGVAMKQCFQVVGQCEVGAIQGAVCLAKGVPLTSAATVWTEAKDCNGEWVHVEVQSDEKGQYLLQGVPTGIVWVFVSWEGKLLQYQVDVEDGITSVVSPIDDPGVCFPDSPCEFGSVSGQVCAADGAAWLSGANVKLAAKDCTGQSVSIEANTDAQGQFWLTQVPAGSHWVQVFTPEGGFQLPITVAPGATAQLGIVGAAECEPASCPKGNVAGTVCPTAGPGSKGAGALAYAHAQDCAGVMQYIEATVGADGVFTLSNVPAGTVWVFVEWQGMVLQRQVQVAPGTTTWADPVDGALCDTGGNCGTGAVSGVVCKPSGDAVVAGAKAQIKAKDCNGATKTYESNTNASGAFLIDGVPAGQHWLAIQDGGAGFQLPVWVEASQVTQLGVVGAAACDPNACGFGNIQGTVCTGQGKPVQGSATATVTAFDCKGAKQTVAVSTGPGGNYTLLGVPAGAVWVFVQWQGQVLQIPVQVEAGKTTVVPVWEDGVCFPNEPCGAGGITGRVCLPSGNAWANGTQLSISSVDCNGSPYSAQTFSDSSGTFWFTGVPEGQHWVVASGNGVSQQLQVNVVAGTTTDVGVVGAASCNPGGGCGKGSITGWACSPSGVKVAGADVVVYATDCQGNPVTLYATEDGAGNFTVANVPSGTVTVTVQKGDYSVTYSVAVPANGQAHVPNLVPNFCFPNNQVKLAVVGGNWDHIEQILDKLGLSYDFYDSFSGQAAGLLANLSLMLEYDVIFFNCGAAHQGIYFANPGIQGNLQQFVASGHSIYASDWAHIYAEFPWPFAIDFVGDDAQVGAPRIGAASTITGVVVDPLLGSYLGKSNVAVDFDLGAWVVMQAPGGNTTVHLQGWVDAVGAQVPLMASHTPAGGSGRVLFTSFHNEKQLSADIEKVLKFLVFEL
jgi:hypothetical protein